jgi:hypothetical protein
MKNLVRAAASLALVLAISSSTAFAAPTRRDVGRFDRRVAKLIKDIRAALSLATHDDGDQATPPKPKP